MKRGTNKVKEKKDYENFRDKDKENFGESGVKLLNLIAEILAETALQEGVSDNSDTDNSKIKLRS